MDKEVFIRTYCLIKLGRVMDGVDAPGRVMNYDALCAEAQENMRRLGFVPGACMDFLQN